MKSKEETPMGPTMILEIAPDGKTGTLYRDPDSLSNHQEETNNTLPQEEE